MVPQVGHFQPAGTAGRGGADSGRLAPQFRQNCSPALRFAPQPGQIQLMARAGVPA